MKKSLLILLLLVFAVTGCVVYPDGGGEVSTEYIVRTLIQDEWRGRLTGTEGNRAAGEFLAGVFQDIGLSPLGGDGFLWGYSQITHDPDVADPRLAVLFADGSERELVFGAEFGVNVYVVPGGTDLTLPVTRDYNDHEISEMNEKFFVSGEFSRHPRIIRPVETMGIGHGFGAAAMRDDFVRADNITISLLAAVYFEIDWDAVQYISFSINESAEEKIVHNIVGFLPGLDRTKAVVVGAHFDGAGYMGGHFSPGALDNASGTAAMLRAAQNIAARNEMPETDIIFAAFNGHENGLFGSRAFASQLLELELYDDIYMIGIDCVGFIGGQPIVLDLSGFARFSTRRDDDIALNLAIAYVMEEWGMEFVDVFRANDHESFQMQGITATNLGQNIFHIEHYIHTAGDRVEILDFGEIDRVGDLIAEVIYRVGADFSFDIGDTSGIRPEIAAHAFDIDHAAIHSEIRRLQQELDLAFDEVYSFKLDNVVVSFGSGSVSYDEFKTFFPDMYIRQEVMGHRLHSLDVGTKGPDGKLPHTMMMIMQDGESPPFRLNEVRRVSLENVEMVLMNYARGQNIVAITVQSAALFMMDFEAAGYTLADPEITGSPHYWVREFTSPWGSIFDLMFHDGELGINVTNLQSMEAVLEWIAYLDIDNDREYYLELLRR